MTLPICINLKNRNGLNTRLKAGNGAGAQWRFSAGNLWWQFKNRTGFRTDSNQPFPRGAPWRWQRRHKVSNCFAVQSSPPRAWQRLHSWAQESMSECELVGGGRGAGNRGQTGYLCLHGQAAISSLCLSHSLYQSCWDCLLRAHWEQTALSSPFSQKNEWVPFTVSSFLELLSTALESSLYHQGCNGANSSSPENQWGLFPHPLSPTHLQTSGQAVLSFLFIQTSTVIKYCGLIILREGGCLPLSPAPGVNHNWSKPTM